MRGKFSVFIISILLTTSSVGSTIPADVVVKQGKTLSSILEQFRLNPNNEYTDAPYYEDARPLPQKQYLDSLLPNQAALYTDLLKCSEGSYLLFGQGDNILQILLAGYKIYALQLNCAMHCRLSEKVDKTFQVIVEQNGEIARLPNRFPRQPVRRQCYRYAAAMPLKIAVNLGDKAARVKPWQIIELKFDPISEEYNLSYWRQENFPIND